MITLILVEINYNRVISYKERGFNKISLLEINKWIDNKFKFGILTNSDYSSINRYGGTIIRNGAIIIKNRNIRNTNTFSNDLNDYLNDYLIEVEQHLRMFKINNILN